MSRIRTVKPSLFKHEGLYDLEKETGLPVRLAFIGLFTCCDKAGRFQWRPRTLKIDVLPYDDSIDFSRVLDALATRGFVVKYEHNGEFFGVIPTFNRHQVINNRESESSLPDPEESSIISMGSTREARVEHASTTRLVHAQGEGKGREGKGREEEWEEEGKGTDLLPTLNASAPRQRKVEDTPLKEACRATWKAYEDAYFNRYGTEPVRNAKVNSQVKQLCQALPHDEAPGVAEHFVRHNDSFYVRKGHDFGLLVTDAAKLRMEWATGRQMTGIRARQEERASSMMAILHDIKRERGEA